MEDAIITSIIGGLIAAALWDVAKAVWHKCAVALASRITTRFAFALATLYAYFMLRSWLTHEEMAKAAVSTTSILVNAEKERRMELRASESVNPVALRT